MKLLLALLLVTASAASYAQVRPTLNLDPPAQIQPRIDDEFFRKRLIVQVDLQEKVNAPLNKAEAVPYVLGEGSYGTKTQGLVEALIRGWKDGKFTAYRPDTLDKPMLWPQFIAQMNKINNATTTTPVDAGTSGDGGGDTGDEGLDTEGLDAEGGDISGDADPGLDAGLGGGGADVLPSGNTIPDLTRLKFVIQIVEDRIFDKVRSTMINDIKYIKLISIDPTGALPASEVVGFDYKDAIKNYLGEVQWKNRFNDAESRSVREIFDLQLFSGVITNYGDSVPKSVQEAEVRKQQLMEYEHNLWSY